MLDKLEKICKNFPTDQAKQEFAKLFNAVAQNPDKAMYLLKNHPEKFSQLFRSDILNQALLTAGISWGVLTTILTYMLESYFASMQKDAGRLGVMKAIDKLDDYRYYADANKTDSNVSIANSTNKTTTKYPSSNWLAKK